MIKKKHFYKTFSYLLPLQSGSLGLNVEEVVPALLQVGLDHGHDDRWAGHDLRAARWGGDIFKHILDVDQVSATEGFIVHQVIQSDLVTEEVSGT